MGTVFEAIDERVNRSVVLKRASHHSPDRVRDFEREAQLLANLRHPSLPRVSDHFIEAGGQYLVMDFVPGNDLGELLSLLRRPFPISDVLRWADELLKVLEYLHGHSPPILHRDIKPANLKLTKDGEIFLLDFGLAKGTAGQMPTVGEVIKSIPGYTPNYAPLEQILRADNEVTDHFYVDALSSQKPQEVQKILKTASDVRADLFSLGATIYHLLTNEAPANAARRTLLVWSGQADPVRPAMDANPLVPDEVSIMLTKAMSLVVDQRPTSAATMRNELREASLSMRMPQRIALNQLSPQAVESIVQLALDRVREEISEVNIRIRMELLRSSQETRKQVAEVASAVTRNKDLTSKQDDRIRNLEKTYSQLTASGKKHSSAPSAAKPGSITAAVEAGKRAYLEDKRKKELATQFVPASDPLHIGEPRIEGRPAEEERLHKDARRFARLLTSEIKLYNDPKVKAGRENNDIYDRLHEDIDRSRSMYEKRVALVVKREWDYFHQELVNVLAEGDLRKMGRNYPGQIVAESIE